MPTSSLVGPSGSTWAYNWGDDFSTWTCPLGSFPSGTDFSPPNTAPGFNNWTSYPHIDADDYHDTSGNGLYMSDACLSVNVLATSCMDVHIFTNPADTTLSSSGTPYVACPIPILGGPGAESGFLYMRTAICWRCDMSLASPLPGYKVAWLNWPDAENWPTGGELDGPECDLNSNIGGFWHWQNGSPTGTQYPTAATGNAFANTSVNVAGGNPGWHTFVKEWSPYGINYISDGVSLGFDYGGDSAGTITSNIPNTPMNWRIQTETNLDGAFPDPSVQGHISIDWVASWAFVA